MEENKKEEIEEIKEEKNVSEEKDEQTKLKLINDEKLEVQDAIKIQL